jgi:hypothetical protein
MTALTPFFEVEVHAHPVAIIFLATLIVDGE